jgi:DNA-binding MarR family transcriptional regulator
MSKPKVVPRLPQTITRSMLKTGRSNAEFRHLLYNFFTVGSRLEEIRRHIGSRLGISGPQFTVLIAVAELEQADGVSVGHIAEHLHVTGTFIAVESGRLARKDYIVKTTSPADRRVSLLRLTAKAVTALQQLAPELQQINDTFFDLTSRAEFVALCASLDRLVANSQRTVDLIRRPRRT